MVCQDGNDLGSRSKDLLGDSSVLADNEIFTSLLAKLKRGTPPTASYLAGSRCIPCDSQESLHVWPSQKLLLSQAASLRPFPKESRSAHPSKIECRNTAAQDIPTSGATSKKRTLAITISDGGYGSVKRTTYLDQPDI